MARPTVPRGAFAVEPSGEHSVPEPSGRALLSLAPHPGFGGDHRRHVVFAVLVGALMILSGVAAAALVGGDSATASASLSTLATVTPTHGSASNPLASSTGVGSSGQVATHEPSINPIPYGRALSSHPLLLQAANEKVAGNASPFHLTPTLPATPSAALNVPPPPPASPNVNYGYVIGSVISSVSPNPGLSGAVVSAEPVTGFCPSIGCNPVTTTANGSFKVAAAVGENEIYLSDAYYVTNRTWAYVTPGAIVSVGAIELVEDGFVTGTVRADDPAQEPIGGINITGESRAGTFVASPSAHSAGNGAFTVAVPPLPSIITFSSIFVYSPFSTNNTFVNVSSGATLDIGTVFLEKETPVSVNLVDATNGQPISGTAASMTVCSKVTGYCANQGTAYGGPELIAAAPVGPDSVTIEAVGFVVNATSLGVVPATSAGTAPVAMGTVDLVPTGAIQTEVNLTGIPNPGDPSSPVSFWGVGLATISACSLDAISTGVLLLSGNMTTTDCTGTCTPIDTPVVIAGLPLRNEISVSPDTAGSCFPPTPTWPISPDLPAFPNTGWTNVTPNKLVNAGSINLLPGTYIQGEVLPKTVGGWSVSACSVDEPAICGQTAYNDSGEDSDFNDFVPNGCPLPPAPQAVYTFCVPAPPGPVKIIVVSTTSSQNYTWAEVPYLQWDQKPLPMIAATDPNASAINLTSSEVSGRVLQAESLTPVIGLPGVEVCPAGAASSSAVCGAGVANPEGFFNVSAPPGWDVVRVSAPQYLSNSTWVFVHNSNSTGTILLTPYGYLAGQVVDPEGNGIIEASVSDCPVAHPQACSGIGADGTTSTDGRYFGAVPAGGIPLGTYEVGAQAPGYTSDWTWVNVTTPGQNFTVPNIVLTPLQQFGGGAGDARTSLAPMHSAASGSNSSGSWVAGRVVDAKYHIGLPTASLTAVATNGAPPVILSTVRGSGGEFNDSLPSGSYVLTVSLTGYYPSNLFINVTGATNSYYVGLVSLVPYPTVTGRLVIDPWSWRQGVTFSDGLGPVGTQVEICLSGGSDCGQATVNSGGVFNVSAPAGTYDIVLTNPTGNGPGMAPGGFVLNRTTVNVTNASGAIGPPILMGLDVFGTILGQVVHAVSTGLDPVMYDTIIFDTTFPVDTTFGEDLNATGGFTMYFPESRALNITVGGLGAWVPEAVAVTNGTDYTNNVSTFVLQPGGVANLGDRFHLEHFGWITMQVTNEATGQAVPYATLSVESTNLLWGFPNQMTATGVANGGGYLNLSAPPSFKVNDSANLSAPDYQYTTFTVHVGSSATTVVNTTGKSNPFSIHPWGWIVGYVSDALTGAALTGVGVSVTGANLQAGVIGLTTNGLGEYVSDAPVNTTDVVALTHAGFSSNKTHYNVTAGEWVYAPLVHLTGDGIVQGRVLEQPGGLPVSGASVTVCPKVQPTCPNTVSTNATGIFTLVAAPGLDVIEVNANGYVTNAPDYVAVATEQWYWVGAVDLYEYANVAGTVLGLPGGVPLGGANASLCAESLTGSGAGPCFTTVKTSFDGAFYLSAPAGTYILEVNDTFYNNSYLPVSIAPGITLPVGVVFVEEDGTATGLVDSATTDAAVSGATVDACQDWGSHACGLPTPAGSDGRYAVSGPPGPYILEASAPGYQTAFVSTRFASGVTTAVPTFLLVPIGPGGRYVVSGTVFSAGSGSAPLGGAIVTASGGTSTYVNVNGTFSFPLFWGTYTLNASLAGYVTQSATITVEGPLSGVDFALPLMTYVLTGTARDGLTGVLLSGVQIWENGAAVGTASGGNGEFTVPLPNGTHDLTAVATDASAYASVPFVVTVAGSAVSRNLDLYPPSVVLYGVVANSLTGQAIAGATITVSGHTSENTVWTSPPWSSDAGGRFSIPAYPGSYVVTATVAGYATTTVSVTLVAGTAPAPVSLSLEPLSTAGTTSSSSVMADAELVGAVVAVGVVAGVLLLWMQRPRSGPRARSRPPVTRPPVGGSE